MGREQRRCRPARFASVRYPCGCLHPRDRGATPRIASQVRSVLIATDLSDAAVRGIVPSPLRSPPARRGPRRARHGSRARPRHHRGSARGAAADRRGTRDGRGATSGLDSDRGREARHHDSRIRHRCPLCVGGDRRRGRAVGCRSDRARIARTFRPRARAARLGRRGGGAAVARPVLIVRVRPPSPHGPRLD